MTQPSSDPLPLRQGRLAKPGGEGGWQDRLRPLREKTWISTILASVAMLLVGAIFWNSPLPYKALESPADEREAGRDLHADFPASGAYMVPSPDADKSLRDELLGISPPATIYVRYESGQPLWGVVLAFVFNLGIVRLIVLAMRRVPVGMDRFNQFYFLSWIGLVAALLPIVSDPISWGRLSVWNVVGFLYTLISWLTVSAILTFLPLRSQEEPTRGLPRTSAGEKTGN